MDRATALEQARELDVYTCNSPEHHRVAFIASALLDAEANGVEWSMAYGWESLDKQHKRLRAEAAKLRGEGI
jgi:hypothetical protein